MNIDDIKNRIYRVGRDIEVAQYNYFFLDDSNEFVALALSLYQNDDGGFGGDLEPDSMNPNSTPFQTSVALEILTEVGFRAWDIDDNTQIMVDLASDYLMKVLKKDFWETTIPSNNDYSCAVWWKYNEEHSRYNPTASLLASLLLLLNKQHKYYQRIIDLSKKLLEKYLIEAVKDKYELICMMRLFYAISELKLFPEIINKAYNKLKTEVNASLDPADEWGDGYKTMPFDYPIIENSFAIPQELIDANINYLKDSLINDHWVISWKWFNDDPAYEMQAIKWQAIIAINNFRK